MNTVMAVTERWLRNISFVSAAVGGTAMLVMLGVIIANIALRPFSGGLRGTLEVSGYLCALAVGLCMPAAQMVGSHIAAGLWVTSLPRWFQSGQKIVSSLVCAGLLFGVAKELLGIAEYASDMGEYIEGVGFSYYGMALGFAFGIALHSVIFIHTALSVVFPVKGGA